MSLVETSVDPSGIVTITLNDETNLNAMSEEMADEFSNLVRSLKASGTAQVIILTGAGRSFSAGGHLAMLDAKRTRSKEENRSGMLKFYDSFLSILSLNVPIIAALHGAAVGAGLCLACAADIRIATEDTKLGFTFLKLGLHPGMGGTFLVPRIVGRSFATELYSLGGLFQLRKRSESASFLSYALKRLLSTKRARSHKRSLHVAHTRERSFCRRCGKTCLISKQL
jgi:enoyl-CoA hydratase/carnithine racemase